MAEEAELQPSKLAFEALGEQLPAAEDLEHLRDVEQVLLQRQRVYQTIVHVHKRAPAQRARRLRDHTADWRKTRPR